MAPLKYFFILIQFNLICGQIKSKSVDTIIVNFDKKIYNNIANDSVTLLYNKQLNIYSKGYLMPETQKHSVSLNYKLKNLYFFSIPKYRLYDSMFDKFDCNSNILDFIEFNEYDKFQSTLICNNKQVICEVDVPNLLFEQQRVCSPSRRNTVTSDHYRDFYIEKLRSYPEGYTQFNEIINNINTNFFFKIWRLEDLLFEFDFKTGELYCYYSGYLYDYGTDRRQLANDFIKKYLGIKKINVLASGNYYNNDMEVLKDPIPCPENFTTNRKVFLKVIRQ